MAEEYQQIGDTLLFGRYTVGMRLKFDISPEVLRQIEALLHEGRTKSQTTQAMQMFGDMRELALRRRTEKETEKPKEYILRDVKLQNRAAIESEILEGTLRFLTPTEEARHLLSRIDELRAELLRRGRTGTVPVSVFISHAGEDKGMCARSQKPWSVYI